MSTSAPPPAVAPPRPNYFFLKRRPHVRNVQRVFVHPPDAEYQKLLKEEGFISNDMVDNKQGTKALRDDLAELEQHLMPHFWRLNQEALFYQNHFYLYQWTFIITTFLTTALAALSVFFYTTKNVGVDDIHITTVLSVLAAVVSAIAAGVSYLGANEGPQRHWFDTRIKAENLRSLYFTYLARQVPFNTDNTAERVRQLQLKTLEVLEGNRS